MGDKFIEEILVGYHGTTGAEFSEFKSNSWFSKSTMEANLYAGNPTGRNDPSEGTTDIRA